MKKLLSLLSVLFLISWCYESFREYVIFEPNHIKDGKYYFENEIYTGKVEGRIEGKIKNGMLDGYVYENHIHRKGGIDNGYHLSQEGKYNNGIKEGWWKFYTEYSPSFMNMSPGVSTHLKWDVLYENDQPKQYKEIIYSGGDNPTNYDIGYIVGSCSSKVNEVSYTHTWNEFDDNLEEYYEKSTTFGKTNECIKSSLYKFYKSDYREDYFFEESQYRIEESFESFHYVKNGPYKRYYKTGELRGEGNYFKGEEDGPYIEYGKDGKIYKKGVYTRGRDSIDGLETRYYRNGQKKSEDTYKDGYYDGLSTKWYENGQKQSEVTIKDGKLISWKEWNEDGSVKE